MKKQNIIFFGLFFISNNIFGFEPEEWQVQRLSNPTFEELKSEIIFGTITNYFGISDAMIDKALDMHFMRIEYMSFTNPVGTKVIFNN